ncbi:MAG TPA: protein kinase [Bryobacteraceae bacterium]|nr:protein kinase [Bryobacteraceae bacterium]
MPLSAGSRLGPYEIVALIGAGGMGEVYRARDTRLGRDVAIKVSKEQFSERFEREARAVAALNHPNICHLYDVGPNYLVMELVEGEALKGPLPLDVALQYAGQIADALDAAHDKGIVHRDLKPGNILITRDGAVKVLDFGLAKTGAGPAQGSESPTFTIGATEAGMILGTAAYMSPEQARGKPVDKRADIWAFGTVLYEMLTGEQLFRGETVSDTLAAVLKEEPQWERIPARVQPLLRRCLEKDPKTRLRDIGDAAALLDIPTPAPSQPSAKQAGVRYGIALGAAALFAIAFGLVSIAHFREKASAMPDPVRFQIALPDKVNLTATGSFSLSPDGKHLAFSAVGPDGHPGVWIHDLDSAAARRLPDADTGPLAPPFFWSPDSRYVVFSGAGVKLRRADIASGAAESLCDLPSPPIGGSWNRDGVMIFGNNRGGLWKVPATGGTPTPLTVLDRSRNERSHELPTFLPDGRHFLYLRSSGTSGNTGIYIGSLDAKPEQQSSKLIVTTNVGAAYVPAWGTRPAHLFFLREGRLMAQPFDDRRMEVTGEPVPVAERVGTIFNTGYFSVSARGVLVFRTGSGDLSQLAWIDRQAATGPALTEPGSYIGLAVAPDGMRAAAVRSDLANAGVQDLWLVDFTRRTNTRFTFGPGRSGDPRWSPDGKQIAFSASHGAAGDLYVKLADGSKEEQLLVKSAQDKLPTSWSRDGRFLLYSAFEPNTKSDIWVLPLDGNRKPFPFLRTPAIERDAVFSPDGRWIAYSSDETGRNEVFVRAFSPDASEGAAASGGKWMVSRDGGRYPWWRPDGKELLYARGGQMVMSVEVASNPVFQAGEPTVAFKNLPGTVVPDYSPDGKRALVAVPVQSDAKAQQFNVLLNWESLLKKR